MAENVQIEKSNGILTLTLARPDKKNALTNEMYGKLADQIEGSENDAAVRVIQIRGKGDTFTAGNDVAEFAAIAAGIARGERHVTRFIRSLGRSTKPLIAAVQGRIIEITARY
jgi:enoyl-CoA hydratase/carnithine racemase